MRNNDLFPMTGFSPTVKECSAHSWCCVMVQAATEEGGGAYGGVQE